MTNFTVHVVCPNPALDRLQLVEQFRPFEVNRVRSVQSLAGGKGIIVARAARRLGATVTAHGFLGGQVGQFIRQGCKDLGINDQHIEIAGETRVTAVIVEERTGRSTVLNERGLTISAPEQGDLLSHLAESVVLGDVVVATGSLPPGCSVDLHLQAAKIALAAGATAVIDAHGDALAAAIDALRTTPLNGSLVLKPNVHELSDVLGQPLSGLAEATAAIRALTAATGATFVVTLGAEGAVWCDTATTIAVDSPKVTMVNPTGSGDSFLAGLAVALGRREDPAEAMRLASAMGAANAATLAPDVNVDMVRALESTVTVTVSHASAVRAGP